MKEKKYLSAAIALSLMTAGSSVFAADIADFGDEEVVVTASRMEEKVSEVPANVTVISGEEIRRQNVFSLRDALSKEVGIFALPVAETKDGIYIRGMQSGDILVMLDGQQLNSAFDGGVNWDAISMENIKKVEIVRGAGSSLYGGHAVAAVVNIITNDNDDDDIHVKANLGVGSNSTWKRGISLSGGADKLHFDIGYNKRTTGGFPGYYKTLVPNTKGTVIATNNVTQLSDGSYLVGSRGRKSKINENININLNYKFTESKELRYTYAHNDYKYDFHDPFTYLHDAAGRDLFNGVVRTQNGDKINAKYSDYIGYDGASAQDIHRLSYSDKDNRFKVGFGYSNIYKEGYSAVLTSGDVPTSLDWNGKGTLTEYPSNSYNLDLQKTWTINNNTLVAGLAWSKSTMDYAIWNLTNWHDWSTKTNKTNSAGGNIFNTALFVQDEIVLDKQWKTYLGLRYDKFTKKDGFSVVNNVRTDYAEVDYNHISPKVAVSFEPTDKLMLFASYGDSFNPPDLNKLFRSSRSTMSNVDANPELEPEISHTFELGAKYQPTEKTTCGITLFRINTKNKIALAPKIAKIKAYYNMDSGMEKGVEFELKHKFDDQWSSYINYTFESGELTNAGVTTRNWEIPKHLLHFGVTNKWGKLTSNFDCQYVSEREYKNTSTDEYGMLEGFFTANLIFNYDFNKNFSAQFSINNIFDKEIFAMGEKAKLEANNGRTFMFGLNMSF